ncbi:hypothetical protein ACEPAF_7667 [Sanghuangporus sanghuang]|uniref:NAD-binding protein n=1 Tax=Sanghuangporus baumii TaxID=108892 RepID=A0A9Q5N6U6_SANBA|nr:NAD-binding protein [Sanghuangporus baumii]
MAANIPDTQLFEYAGRVRGQTVLITGAAKGLGREAAVAFGRYGANIVIGDIDVESAEETVSEVKKVGGDAVAKHCNVLEYDQQAALFQFALSKYGRIDVVIPNAGVTEIASLTTVRLNEQGLPTKPNLKTVEINLISVLYTTQLAAYYLAKNENEGSLKTLVLIGSMGSIAGIPGAPLYSSSKHAIIGLMRSIKDEFGVKGLRVATVCPWFADTAIVPTAMKVLLAGIPFVPTTRVAAAFVRAATDADTESNGAAYTLPDEREVYRIPHTSLNEGVYKMINDRVKRLKSFGQSIITFVALVKLFARSPLTKLLIGAAVGYKAYQIAVSRGLV